MPPAQSLRLKWMVSIVCDFFGFKESSFPEEFQREQKYSKLIDDFLNGQGPPRIFFYYQKQFKDSSGEMSETGNTELFCSTGEKEKIVGKAIYFVRCTPSGKGVNLTVYTDSDILFGEICPSMINSMETLFNKVFIPMVKNTSQNEWLLCEEENKQEFTSQMDKFSQELTEALSTSKHGFTLEKYDKKFENDILNPTKGVYNKEATDDVDTKTKNNIEKITKALEDKEEEIGKPKDEGPRSELYKWSQRLQKLTKVSEEMKLKEIKDMNEYLAQSQRGSEKTKGGANLLHSWREQDIKLTEYLNEAKDNVKYLKTLDIFLEPLYSGTPQTIIDSLPALMNSIKMIHTIAKYYNKSENMTKLFVKITIQMIANCTKEITKGGTPSSLWDDKKHPPEELIKSFSYCNQLNSAYKKQYKETQEKLAQNIKGKKFDFSESQIFSKFDLFVRRVNKLTELFKTIEQFNTLKAHNLKEETNDKSIIGEFDKKFNEFKKKNFDQLLQYDKTDFDRDFVSFNVEVSNLEAQLQGYIGSKFNEIHNVEQSVKFLKKFQDMLKRENLKSDINAKYSELISLFGTQIDEIRTQFKYGIQEIQEIQGSQNEKDRKVTFVRNMPTVAKFITWDRHLLEMIYRPIKYFPPQQLNKPEFKRFGKNLSDLGIDLINAELRALEQWEKYIDQSKEGLQAPLIVEHESCTYTVNFDENILTLIKEAKCLSRMNIKIKESAKIILLQEEKFKRYKYELEYLIKEYDRICGRIRNNTQLLLHPHLLDLKYIIYNGMVILTWSSMNIDSFIFQFHNGLRKLEQLLITIYDIMDNRIDNKLKALSKTILVDLPEESKTYSLDAFVVMQEEYIKKQSLLLKAKNIEVENAVNDLVSIIKKYPRDPNTGPIDSASVNKLIQYYMYSMYRALCHATKTSLNALKERVCDRHLMGVTLKPFFEVEVALEGSKCVLHPSLEEIQKSINKAANAVLKTTKEVARWSQSEEEKESGNVKTFYDLIAQEKEIVKVILLLTGSIQGTKNSVNQFLAEFNKYESLWNKEINKSLEKFVKKNPTLDDYEEKLSKFTNKEAEINKIESQKVIGAMALKTQKLKDGLKEWIAKWKRKFSLNLHEKAKLQMETLSEDIKQKKIKLNREVKDIESLCFVMASLDDIRKKEGTIEQELKPINFMYAMLDKYLPPNELEREEMDAKQQLFSEWSNLVELSKKIRKDLQLRQKEFKDMLIKNVAALQEDVIEFRKEFDKSGPMCQGLTPKEALDRLKRFKDQYDIRKRKFNNYRGGENLFNLKNKEYPYLDKINDEINLLDKLYKIYKEVTKSIDDWRGYHWADVGVNINEMNNKLEEFKNSTYALPKVLQTWPAYGELKQIIEEWYKLIPLITGLAQPSIKDRHWEELKTLTKKDIPYKSDLFVLANLLDATDLNKITEEIEDLCESAKIQLKIENSLRTINQYWDVNEFIIKTWKKRETPCVLDGKRLEDVQEKLDEHITQLSNMKAQKHVGPFKEKVDQLLDQLNNVNDLIETWKKVQIQWISQESVFKGGDIAKSLPQETKKFNELDKKWLKVMDISVSQKKVIPICTDGVIIKHLGELIEGLAETQQKLDQYLEHKRRKFSRFYFVSNLVLLTVLSQGSDPDTIQEYFENLFDAISKVEFGEDKKVVSKIMQTIAKVDEEVELVTPVRIDGNIGIEDWLKKLEAEMQVTIKDLLRKGNVHIAEISSNISATDFIKFVQVYKAQACIVALQYLWTREAENSFTSSREKGNKGNKLTDKASKLFNNLQLALSDYCLTAIPTKLERIKIETLVTIQVHQRFEYDRLISSTSNKVDDPNNFEWQKQTRVYWDNEINSLKIKITDVDFEYVYEYLGVKERLCITPLTDRCYITLAQALGMCYGGSPAGPAGTGKTETVKDMGRTLGVFVVVTNCGPNFTVKDMGRNFKGIVQSGVWGCFDEVNRVSLVVLSVVAMQIETIAKAKKMQLKKFDFPGENDQISFVESSAYFITMNPGYAGRVELPENMKVQFRGVTMMLPDRQKIIEVKLTSAGYKESEKLSIKFYILYGLCEEQLSKQRHYDFGLRNILSVLRTAGNVKREDKKIQETAHNKETPEDELLLRTLNTMNKSKLVSEDIGLFEALLKDIFTKTPPEQKVSGDIMERAVKAMKEKFNIELDPNDVWVSKINQLYETFLVRHGIMMVGPTGTGKSSIMNILAESLGEGKGTYKLYRLFPKAFTNDDMYGSMSISQEWTEGIFSAIWKKYNKKETKEDTKDAKYSWIVCDGPIDADWIENLNSVLDDNKLLTLANSDRIPMTDNVKLMFEVENLNNASPATVSRCGIIYVSPADLTWKSLFRTWLLRRYSTKAGSSTSNDKAVIENLMKKYVEQTKILEEGLLQFNHVMELNTAIRITSLLNLLSNVLDYYQQSNLDPVFIEKLFIYSMVWSLGALLEPEDREKFHKYLENAKAPLPSISHQKMSVEKETVYDYMVSKETGQWKLWNAEEWIKPKIVQFSQLLIPTVDTTRTEFVINLIRNTDKMTNAAKFDNLNNSFLIVGATGTSKTTAILLLANKFEKGMLFKRANFSSLTTPKIFCDIIDGEVDRTTGKNFEPKGGDKKTIFLDDVNMPVVNKWGDQETLEIVRELFFDKGYYFMGKEKRGEFKRIEKLLYVAAMNHPGGGRNDIPNRLKRLMYTVNMTLPSQRSVDNIYSSILKIIFTKKFSPEVIKIAEKLTEATNALREKANKSLKPTPTKFHYIFNLRDISRVFQGIYQTTLKPEYQVIQKATLIGKMSSELFLVGLWRHECIRVFLDKLINENDKKVMKDNLDKVTVEKFRDISLDDESKLLTDLSFCDFLREEETDSEGMVRPAQKVYEAIPDMEMLKRKVEEKMQLNNEQGGKGRQLHLVLFSDALAHLLRISRVIQMSRGSVMLVGVGGSGKQSLTKLSSFIATQDVFRLAVTKSYTDANFFEDFKDQLKKMVDGKGIKVQHTFLFTDNDIKRESFLEYVSSFLSTGEIAGLLAKEDKDNCGLKLKQNFTKEYGCDKNYEPTPNELYSYFLNWVRDRLHFVICFSPVGQKFRERFRKFPSIFNSCTIDWFLPWPEDAMISVAASSLKECKIECTAEAKKALAENMGKVHSIVSDICGKYFQKMRRNVYVTPKSFLSYISLYKKVYKDKFDEIFELEQNVSNGLDKLTEAKNGVTKLGKDLEKDKAIQQEKKEQLDVILKKLEEDTKVALAKAEEVNRAKENCEKEKALIEKQAEAAQKDLDAAMPAFKGAEAAAKKVNNKNIAELKTYKKIADCGKLVMDLILILFQNKIIEARERPNLTEGKSFINDSFDDYGKPLLMSDDFCKNLMNFLKDLQDQKNEINDEMVELLEPYFNLNAYFKENAPRASNVFDVLFSWASNIAEFYRLSKEVTPKIAMLKIKKANLEEVKSNLKEAEKKVNETYEALDKLKKESKDREAECDLLRENCNRTTRKMNQAQSLINKLAEENIRWSNDKKEFKDRKDRLIGDVAICCSFISYAGPFNSEFRQDLKNNKIINDIKEKNIPFSDKLDLILFMTDDSIRSEWSIQELPSDTLSLENAIMVTTSSRFPLLIDPQGQAFRWILKKELEIEQRIKTMEDPKLRESVKNGVENGYAILIIDVPEEIDPMLDPILEKQTIKMGKSLRIDFGDGLIEFSPNFMLYMTSRMSNPHFSPEIAAKTTIIDFTVTLSGLEEQLLGKVISKEQKSLEDQLKQLMEDVCLNTKEIQDLNKQLLQRLSNTQGSLLDNTELIDHLTNVKVKALEVQTKLKDAQEKKIEIGEKRKIYVPIALRGSVLYFCVVDMGMVNWMYNTSLLQFLILFDQSIDTAVKSPVNVERVKNILNNLTMTVIRYISRGLFEKDKITFLTMICLKILSSEKKITTTDIMMFLKCGEALDDKNPLVSWLKDKAWPNLKALSKHKFAQDSTPFFKDLQDEIKNKEPDAWQQWGEGKSPEGVEIPHYNDRLKSDKEVGQFIRLTLIRAIRSDRTVMASIKFVEQILGPEYSTPQSSSVEDIYKDSLNTIPVLFLLSPGADPISSLEELSKKKKKTLLKVSLGEGQEQAAIDCITSGRTNGLWVVLQNCHLGIELMAKIETYINPKAFSIHNDFRLFLTTEPSDRFPLGLLQMCLKVTNEPPRGLKAGLLRTYNTIITQDVFEKSEQAEWKPIIVGLSTMHSIIQERRKFGPIGFCIPYEFNNSDLEASLTFVERHIIDVAAKGLKDIKWENIQYMVYEIQYGGRITDDNDRDLFKIICQEVITTNLIKENRDGSLLKSNHFFFPYKEIQKADILTIRQSAQGVTQDETPEQLGLNQFTDIILKKSESLYMINTLIDTQPKDVADSNAKSKEEEVKERTEELIKRIPHDFIEIEYRKKIEEVAIPAAIAKVGDRAKMVWTVPMNAFYLQEIQRLQSVIAMVKKMMLDIVAAIEGTMIMTPEIVEAINAIFDNRVPKKWMYDAAEVEISWLASSLSSWFNDFENRDKKIREYLQTKSRPTYYWLPGFFNPAGFLTAVKQENARTSTYPLESWEYETRVMNDKKMSVEQENKDAKPIAKSSESISVFVYGLYLEGAVYNKGLEEYVTESSKKSYDNQTKELHSLFPVIEVSAQSSQGTNKKGAKDVNKAISKQKDGSNNYLCPVYKYAKRTTKYIITKIKVACNTAPNVWAKRGVALLCNKDY